MKLSGTTLPVDCRCSVSSPIAVAVFSARRVQIGYLTAERCGWIGKIIAEGREVRCIFQQTTKSGAIIRAAFDGNTPLLPKKISRADEKLQEPDDFYPDEFPEDD